MRQFYSPFHYTSALDKKHSTYCHNSCHHYGPVQTVYLKFVGRHDSDIGGPLPSPFSFLWGKSSLCQILPVSSTGALSMLFTWVRTAIHKLYWLSVNRSKPPLLLMSQKREREELCSKSYRNRSELVWRVMSCDITDTAKLNPGRFSNAKVQNPYPGRSKIE